MKHGKTSIARRTIAATNDVELNDGVLLPYLCSLHKLNQKQILICIFFLFILFYLFFYELFSWVFFFVLHLNSSEIALEWNPMAKWVQRTNTQSCFMQNMERQHKILFKWYNSVRLLLPHFFLSWVAILSFVQFFSLRCSSFFSNSTLFDSREFLFCSHIQSER